MSESAGCAEALGRGREQLLGVIHPGAGLTEPGQHAGNLSSTIRTVVVAQGEDRDPTFVSDGGGCACAVASTSTPILPLLAALACLALVLVRLPRRRGLLAAAAAAALLSACAPDRIIESDTSSEDVIVAGPCAVESEAQINAATQRANLILFVVDVQSGLCGLDFEFATLLRRHGLFLPR